MWVHNDYSREIFGGDFLLPVLTNDWSWISRRNLCTAIWILKHDLSEKITAKTAWRKVALDLWGLYCMINDKKVNHKLTMCYRWSRYFPSRTHISWIHQAPQHSDTNLPCKHSHTNLQRDEENDVSIEELEKQTNKQVTYTSTYLTCKILWRRTGNGCSAKYKIYRYTSVQC